eukprot:7133967-Prymnesium_polylepis.1
MSNVCDRPRADVMPATAKVTPAADVNISVVPAASEVTHSRSCKARSPLWHAASAAEHAVSTVMHGPCSPSTYESRPAAIDTDEPVAAYTLLLAGDTASRAAKSLPEKPTKTPVRLPPSVVRFCDASCSAMYPRSSSSRWHGSIAAASAGEIANAALSASCVPHTKPAWRARLEMGFDSSAVTARTSHLADGTSLIASHPHAAKTPAARRDVAPAGSSLLVPSTATAAAAQLDGTLFLAAVLTAARSGCSTDTSCRAVG